MTTIQLNGQTYRMSYNLLTAITFERMTGKNPLQLDELKGEVETMTTIAYCMLLANNDPALVPDMDEFLQSITGIEQMQTLITTASQEMIAFFNAGKAADTQGGAVSAPHQEDQGGDTPKN